MIFITGCNGLVGSFIARKLVNSNYYVRALRRENSDLSLVKDIEHKIEWISGDILDMPLIEKALQDVDTVIHSAAVISYYPPDKKKMFRTNVEGTATLVNAALNRNVSRFIHVSSVAALGRKKNLTDIDENVYWENSSYNTNYGISKYQAELEVWRGHEEGLKTVIVNPSIVFGPGNWESGSTGIFRYAWEQNLFYPEGEMNFVDVRDVTETVCRLMNEDRAAGERFILNGGKLSYQDVLFQIADHFGRKRPRFKAGPFLAGLAWRTEATKSLITGKTPSITRETARISKHHFYYNNSKISNFLNFKFVPPQETIKWVCGELRKKYNV